MPTKTFYRSSFALVFATLRFKKMSRGKAQCRESLSAIGPIESEPGKGSRSVNLLTGFVKPGGTSFEPNLRLSPEFDLKSELMNGRVKALTKTDFLGWQDSRTSKRTSCFIITPDQFVANYKNWAFAQPFEDRHLGSYKSTSGFLERLMEMILVSDVGEGLSQSWGKVYKRYSLDLEQSGSQSLATPS